MDLNIILGAIIAEGVLLLITFIGSTLYLKGSITAKLEAHDKEIAQLQDETVSEKTCLARMGAQHDF